MLYSYALLVIISGRKFYAALPILTLILTAFSHLSPSAHGEAHIGSLYWCYCGFW